MAEMIRDEDFLAFIGRQESQFMAPPSQFRDETIERFQSKTDGLTGDKMPWAKTHDKIRLRPGEVSLWPGINGHGKSLALGQCAAWLIPERRCLIASMEMKPAATLERMLRQCAGTSVPADMFMDRWFAWTDDKLWIYDQTDTVAPDRIVGMVHYAAQELSIKHIVIDSLMKCGIRGQSDAQYAGQRDFVDRLAWAAKSLDCHIHLVHHMRKGERETTVPDKFDIKGAGEIADMVDNIFIVHRNKIKEKNEEEGKEVNRYEPDATITCAKQRNGEWEGRVALYFDGPSQQFVPNPDKGPMYWLGQNSEDWGTAGSYTPVPEPLQPHTELYGEEYVDEYEPGVAG